MYTPSVLLELPSYAYSGKFICPGLHFHYTNHQFIIQLYIPYAVETVPPQEWGWVGQKLHCDLTVKFPDPCCFSPESTFFLSTVEFHKIHWICWLAEDLLGSHKGLFSMEIFMFSLTHYCAEECKDDHILRSIFSLWDGPVPNTQCNTVCSLTDRVTLVHQIALKTQGDNIWFLIFKEFK